MNIFAGPELTLEDGVVYVPAPGSTDVPSYVNDAMASQDDPSLSVGGDAEILVFSAVGCPHCPMAVKAAVQVAKSSDSVRVTIVDAQGNPDAAAMFGVKSVPFSLLDRELSWVGVIPAGEVASKILARESEGYQDTVFESMLESGRFGQVKERLGTREGMGQFGVLWKRSTTSSRIGMMMVVEEVLEEDPLALDELSSLITDAAKSDDAALRGDTADLLGQIGHPSARPALESLLSDPNPDVAEIAEEGLEAIRDRESA